MPLQPSYLHEENHFQLSDEGRNLARYIALNRKVVA